MKLKIVMHCLAFILETTTDTKIFEVEVNGITIIKHMLRGCFIEFFLGGCVCVSLF